MPRFSSYVSETRSPMFRLMASAILSLRTLNSHRSCAAPGIFTMDSSPSHVLQSQPLRENFCTYPARSHSEYVHESATQVHMASSATGTAMRIPREKRSHFHRRRRL